MEVRESMHARAIACVHVRLRSCACACDGRRRLQQLLRLCVGTRAGAHERVGEADHAVQRRLELVDGVPEPLVDVVQPTQSTRLYPLIVPYCPIQAAPPPRCGAGRRVPAGGAGRQVGVVWLSATHASWRVRTVSAAAGSGPRAALRRRTYSRKTGAGRLAATAVVWVRKQNTVGKGAERREGTDRRAHG